MLNHFSGVMAGLVSAIHVWLAEALQEKTWVPATTGSPPRHAAGCHCAGMTRER